jgi:DNA-binding LacI/PurR family transcriptional regulator
LSRSKKSVTSDDVAELAGVSRSAVSRAFTEGASVSEETRQKILAAANKLGYQPNIVARTLTMQQSKIIGVVMGEWLNPFYTQMLRRLSEYFRANKYQVMLTTLDESHDVDSAIRFLMQYQVDGLLLVSSLPTEATAEVCAQRHTPIVIINRESDDLAISNVTIDQKQLGEDLANQVLDRGYRRIALARGDDQMRSGVERIDAFNAVLQQREEGQVIASVSNIYGHDTARATLPQFMDSASKPDIIICSSDEAALGFRDGLRLDYNVDVPNDISVIGFGDAPFASWGVVQLSTVRLPIESIIDTAADTLLKQIEDESISPKSIMLNAGIVWRKTTRAS